MNKIAIVGNPPADKIEMLDALLGEEDLKDLCHVVIYSDTEKSDEQLLTEAIADYKDGHVKGIVCLPMKCSVKELVAKSSETENPDLMKVYVNTLARLASVREAKSEAALTMEDVVARVTLLSKSLKRDLNILNPRICMLCVNKEVTETSEEMTLMAPAINELVKNGIQVFGPLPYQGFFERKDIEAFDGIVQIYADGAMQNSHHTADAMQKNCNEPTVTMLTGSEMPVVLTAAEGMITAIGIVLDMIHNRYVYDIPFRHPLPKLYHERKEDGDKARFAKVKKGFNPAEHRRENVTYTTTRQPKTAPETAPAAANKAEGAE